MRRIFNDLGVLESSGFARDFDLVSVRLGAVAKVLDDVFSYAQYIDGMDPVNANIFLVNSGENLDLTDAKQWELGSKGSWQDGRAVATIAYFDIERDDVLERRGVDSAASIGGRYSSGLEVSSSFNPTPNRRVGANASLIEAEFKRSTNFVTFAGNRPPNVADKTGNMWTSYGEVAGLPLEIGGSVQYADDRFGDNANQFNLCPYTLVDFLAA